jgi:hypothetical protein
MGHALNNIDPNAPLRLKDAIKIAFPLGGMTVSGLRREINRGRLSYETIAGKQFVTLRSIEEMRTTCRVEAKDHGYGCNQPERTDPGRSSNKRSLSSVTAQSSAALDAARAKLSKLKENSGTISTPSQPNVTAIVTHLPSSSRT